MIGTLMKHEREDEEGNEVIDEVDWRIDNDYLAAAVEGNLDSKFITCLCIYSLVESLKLL